MAVIAEPFARPASRFHFLLDRREVLEWFLVAPAIIYVLLLVGLPLLLAVYYSLSAYTVYDPTWKFVGLKNFADIIQNPTFNQTLVNTFIFTFGSQLLGLVLGKFGAFLLSSKPASKQNFEAQIESGSIADMGLVLFENSPVTVTRTALHVAHSESDSLFVCQQVRGS